MVSCHFCNQIFSNYARRVEGLIGKFVLLQQQLDCNCRFRLSKLELTPSVILFSFFTTLLITRSDELKQVRADTLNHLLVSRGMSRAHIWFSVSPKMTFNLKQYKVLIFPTIHEQIFAATKRCYLNVNPLFLRNATSSWKFNLYAFILLL